MGREWPKHLFLAAVAVAGLAPFAMMLAIAFKTNDQFLANPWWFDAPAAWQWGNWRAGWQVLAEPIANSIAVTAGAALLAIALAVPAAYILARGRFPGRELAFYAILSTLFLPGGAAALVTTYDLMRGLGLVDSLWALVLLSGVSAQATAIYLLRQAVEDIPRELFEAATIDGAGIFVQLRHIVLPLTAPAIGTVAIVTALATWNDLVLPLILLADPQRLTVPVALMRLDGEYVKAWGPLMAACTIAALPLVLLFAVALRAFVRGLTAGAVKG